MAALADGEEKRAPSKKVAFGGVEKVQERRKAKRINRALYSGPPSMEDAPEEEIVQALAAHALFRGCDVRFVEALLARAETRRVVAEEEIDAEEEDGLFIVRRGALHMRVGSSQFSKTTVLGPGGIFNSIGFMGLTGIAQAFRPRRQTLKLKEERNKSAVAFKPAVGYDPEVPEGTLFAGVPEAIQDRRHECDPPEEGAHAQVLDDKQLCFFNTCPYGALSWPLWTKPDFMYLRVVGAGEKPQEAQDNGEGEEEQVEAKPEGEDEAVQEASEEGGATVAVLPPMSAIMESLRAPTADKRWGLPQAVLQDCVQNMEKNGHELDWVWRTLMKTLGTTCLAGAPPEAVWAVAERSDVLTAPRSSNLASEYEAEPDGDSLLIVADGVATVLRRNLREGKMVQEVIGRLRPGTVIGDVCLMGVGIARPATIFARTDLRAVRVTPAKLFEVFDMYPGVLEGIETRLQDTAEYLQAWLPTKTEFVRALKVFEGCDLAFLCDLAKAGERQAMYYGHIVLQEGAASADMYVLECGRCSVETVNEGQVNTVRMGNCFGERTLLGIAEEANATIRVITPIALVFKIAQATLQATLELHPSQRRHFELLKLMPGEGRVVGNPLRNLELFRTCGAEFLEALGQVVLTRGYLPGQTVVVQGDREEDPCMYAITGGRLSVESNGQQATQIPTGATFGELLFLGSMDRRNATVRAITFAFLIVLHRSAFFSVLEEFPEEKEAFPKRLNTLAPWPCFRGLETRLLHLIDMHADRRFVAEGDKSFQVAPLNSVAILVLAGKAAVVDCDGTEIEKLSVGHCFNAQILTGASVRVGEFFLPRTNCEIRLLSLGQLQRALAEFPSEKGRLHRAVLRHMAEWAERRLGHEPGGTGAIRHVSAFFNNASDLLLQKMRAVAEPYIYESGDVICGRNLDQNEPTGTEMYLVLYGNAQMQDPFSTTLLPPGAAYGEAVMLGIAARYPGVLLASTLCLLLVIRRRDFEDTIKGFPQERAVLEGIREQANYVDIKRIQSMLLKSKSLKEMPKEAIHHLCPRNNVVLFAPGAPIFEHGEKCVIGEAAFYLVLAGMVQAEGTAGTILGTIGPGDVFGEIAAWGLSELRTATCRASWKGMVACACFTGPAILSTHLEHPEARNTLEAYMERQAQANKEAQAKRKAWLNNVAVPALRKTWLLGNCSHDFLYSVAVNLQARDPYAPGAVIASAGQPSTVMLVIIEGTVVIEAACGAVCGHLSEGGTFGEVCALKLFDTWMATVRAVTSCAVLEVKADALKVACSKPTGTDPEQEPGLLLERLVAGRRDQVNRGIPLSALNMGVDVGDISTRVIALLSQRIHLRPKQMWAPVKDDNPCGPYLLVLLSGHASVVMGADHKLVMGLPRGTVMPEGPMADFGAVVKAIQLCDAYRIRQSDFNVAVEQDPAAKKWMWSFRLKEKEVADRLRNKLSNASGLLRSQGEHIRDKDIKDFVSKRQQNCMHATLMRSARDGLALQAAAPAQKRAVGSGYPALTHLPSLTMGSRWQSGPGSERSNDSGSENEGDQFPFAVFRRPRRLGAGGLADVGRAPHHRGRPPQMLPSRSEPVLRLPRVSTPSKQALEA